MKTLVSIFALAMALAFTAPAVAGTGAKRAAADNEELREGQDEVG